MNLVQVLTFAFDSCFKAKWGHTKKPYCSLIIGSMPSKYEKRLFRNHGM